MSYLVNEVFYTLQGEGYWTGRPAVFCRFSRCNLWTGREEDRHRAVCQFCDTNFLHGDKYSEIELAEAIDNLAPPENRMVVFTGGEPSLQLDQGLVDDLRNRRFYVAIETNGTRQLPDLDWVCVSPKANTVPAVRTADEMKLVFPQTNMPPELAWCLIKADHYWLSPMDGPNLAENTAKAVDYVQDHPQWRLNIQTHKVIGVR